MTELPTEFENMNISRDYFSFIKDVYNDYIKYIKQYKLISGEYMKKLNLLQEKYSPQLNELNKNHKKKYKNLKTKFILSLTSTIPKIISQLIENVQYITDGIESSIKILETTLNEKTNLALKYQESYDESKAILLKNYKAIDKLKISYMNSMSSCEDLIYKYFCSKNNQKGKNKKSKKDKKEKKEKKDKKDKNDLPSNITEEQMNNSIAISKKLETQYKNSFESTGILEKSFNEIANEYNEKMYQFSWELLIKLKDIIIDFIVLLKNSFKLPLSEIDLILPEICDIDNNTLKEKIVDESLLLNNKLINAKPIKYKLKCANQPMTIEGKYNPNNHIVFAEDGFKDLFFIDDLPTFLTLKKFFENFELIDNEEIDLKLEEEKMKGKDLTSKMLSFRENNKGNSNILLSEEEIEELNNLLDKHYNRVLFLQSLSTFRAKGTYELPNDIFELIYKFFLTIIDTIERDKDFHCAKNIIILSQTYYYLKNGIKIYLQEKIKDNELFRKDDFWKECLEYTIEKEIVNSIKTDSENGTLIKENQKESDDFYSNIVFAQLVPLSDNMIEFGLDRKKIKEIIKPIIKHYNMNDQSIDVIDDIIHKNCERKSIRLNEEIKLFSNNIININNNKGNNDRNLNLNNDDNLNEIYEDVEVEDEDEDEKDNEIG